MHSLHAWGGGHWWRGRLHRNQREQQEQEVPTSPATSLQKQESGNLGMMLRHMKDTEQAQGENAKGQSWTDGKGASYEMGSTVGKHIQQNPAKEGIHFIWKGLSYMQSRNREAVPSGLSFSRNHFLEGKNRGKIPFCY